MFAMQKATEKKNIAKREPFFYTFLMQVLACV